MKRILIVLLSLILLLSLIACASSPAIDNTPQENTESSPVPPEEKEKVPAAVEKTDEPTAPSTQAVETMETPLPEREEVRIAAMTGPTGMGMAKLLSDNEAGTAKNRYSFTLAGASDEITPLLVKGELDIAAVPLNLASVLYNKTEGQLLLLAVNTKGVLYLLDNDGSVESVADLKGRTVYATGKGSTPEYSLRYILLKNGLDPDQDLTIEFKSEPTEIVAAFKNAQGSVVAMLPQPYVTVAKTQVENLHVALDLTEEWNKLEEDSVMLTGCVVVQRSFLEEHPAAVEAFLDDYRASIDFVNSNVEEAAEMMESFGIVKAAVAKKAIPDCNIVFFTDAEAVKGYLQVLFDQNPAAVGGKMPGDDFYAMPQGDGYAFG